jgi:hypothetical protein
MNDKIPYLVACTANIDQNTKKSSIRSSNKNLKYYRSCNSKN